VSRYTDAVIEDSWGVEQVRHVLFPTFVLHVVPAPEAAGYLGFTHCGRMIPHRALLDGEIPERFRPPMCRHCEQIGLAEPR
jgi:hypothetical protein